MNNRITPEEKLALLPRIEAVMAKLVHPNGQPKDRIPDEQTWFNLVDVYNRYTGSNQTKWESCGSCRGKVVRQMWAHLTELRKLAPAAPPAEATGEPKETDGEGSGEHAEGIRELQERANALEAELTKALAEIELKNRQIDALELRVSTLSGNLSSKFTRWLDEGNEPSGTEEPLAADGADGNADTPPLSMDGFGPPPVQANPDGSYGIKIDMSEDGPTVPNADTGSGYAKAAGEEKLALLTEAEQQQAERQWTRTQRGKRGPKPHNPGA